MESGGCCGGSKKTTKASASQQQQKGAQMRVGNNPFNEDRFKDKTNS